MKSIKKLGIAVLIIVIVISLAGMFLPSTIKIERSIRIKAPVNIVFDQVNILKNWETWSPWKQSDPTVKLLYNDIAEGDGASFSWSGVNSDKGTLLITHSIPDSLVIILLEFKDQGSANVRFNFEESVGEVKVNWLFENEVGNNPLKRFFWSIGKKTIQESIDKGLNNIKEKVEKQKT
jgi:hypothetical protein